MVKTGIVGYTPLNGHPYSFGCILNGFDKETKINQYPQIESYLKKNLKRPKITDEIRRLLNNSDELTLSEDDHFHKVMHEGINVLSKDGAESLIPALEQVIKRGGQVGVKEIKIGMPHRGRLNVLANVLQKSYKRNAKLKTSI